MDNPFLSRSFQIPWSQLTPDRVQPAIEAALADAEVALDRITATLVSEANYTNAFLALEQATELLNESWAKVTHLNSVADSAPLREAHNAMLPKVSAFFAKIPLNGGLWERLKVAAARPESAALTGEHRRFLDETMADFRQQGADLSAEPKARLEAVQSELAQLTQKYSENVLDATNAWELLVSDPARLQGLPAHAREAARQNALKKGHGSEAAPVWRFTLHAPSLEPVMLYAEDGELRRQVWTAAAAVGREGAHDNRELVKRILALRQEKAALLGQPHFADFVLQRRMAKSGAQALAFVEDLHRRIGPAFARECRELEAFKAEQTQSAPGRLAPWETGFWAERLPRSRYDFDEEQVYYLFGVPRRRGAFPVTVWEGVAS